MKATSFLLLGVVGVSSVYGYGAVGHQAVGKVAEELLNDQALAQVQNILSDDNEKSLEEVSTWPDRIRGRPEFKWTSVLHYTSAQDDPPEQCFRPQDLVCPKSGCIIDAIVNYTMLLLPEYNTPKPLQAQSLKFLTHFLGDLHQPLHISSKSRGGNEERVNYGKKKTNLHSIWDSSIIEKKIRDEGKSEEEFQANILQRAQSSDAKAFTAKCEVKDPAGLKQCIQNWGAEIGAWNCKHVWRAYLKYKGADMSARYTDESLALDIPEQLLVKGAIRLAYILNSIWS